MKKLVNSGNFSGGGKEGDFGLSGGMSRWYLMEKLAINGKIKQFVYI